MAQIITGQQTYMQPTTYPQAPPIQANDPLFEALVKYVTSGVDALPVSSSALEEHLNTLVAVPGGRSYLESLVSPTAMEKMPTFKAWKYELVARGYFHMTSNQLNLDFNARLPGGPGIPLIAAFDGSAPGIYSPRFVRFDGARFFLDSTPAKEEWTFKVTQFPTFHSIIVTFFDKSGNEVGQLYIDNISIMLPPFEPQGTGTITTAQ